MEQKKCPNFRGDKFGQVKFKSQVLKPRGYWAAISAAWIIAGRDV